ncbi:hypothetical protein [Haliangium ochraceum]|uniref:Uncharacterized protein n=1 Tax=Haliangium ochraceum (strain DSM 14365 / JCM 11303 / SMP-2) TaxID=502025 RepID=D0LIR4_HALO1|nr:hypothetical protein [Haliangium ochraceum]ACY12943.1 hypothetical protein Hoch_0302 [Haliangium ochraceum DSM 14365]
MIRLLLIDYRRGLGERKVKLLAIMYLYAVIAMPLVLAQPPAHVRQAIGLWLDTADPFATFLFAWIDLAMNKIVAFAPVVLAGGILLHERDTGQLAIFAAKPLSLERYFLVRALSACAIMLTLHLGANALGAVLFGFTVEGFAVLPFAAAMLPHLCVALCTTALAAAIAMLTRRRSLSLALGMLTLFSLVGVALFGLINPAWRTAALFNPLSLGVEGLRFLDHADMFPVLAACAALLGWTALLLALGTRLARRLEVVPS